MKARLCCVFFIMIFIEHTGLAGIAGEFIVHVISGNNITVTASFTGLGYGWDTTLNRIVYISSFSSTISPYTPNQYAWDNPGSQKNGHQYMPWALVSFDVKNNGNSFFSFSIDFRDTRWANDESSSGYPSHDTYLYVDADHYKCYLAFSGHQSMTSPQEQDIKFGKYGMDLQQRRMTQI